MHYHFTTYSSNTEMDPWTYHPAMTAPEILSAIEALERDMRHEGWTKTDTFLHEQTLLPTLVFTKPGARYTRYAMVERSHKKGNACTDCFMIGLRAERQLAGSR